MGSDARGSVLIALIAALLLGGLAVVVKGCNDSNNATISKCIEAGRDPLHCSRAINGR